MGTLFTFIGCSGEKVGIHPTHQVYEVLLNEVVADPMRPIKVLDQTEAQILRGASYDEIAEHLQSNGPIPVALLRDLVESANQSKSLEWNPVLVNATFISKSAISKNENWASREFSEAFWSAYPDDPTFYALSDVAFDKSYTKAVVLYSFYCPVMCGAQETVIYLEKHGPIWSIIRSVSSPFPQCAT